MSISKDIVIKEWMTDKNITAETLTTDEVGSGSLIWVPWEARANVGELNVSHNGEYLAADEGLFGWTKVNVMVAGGDDAQLEITEPDGTVHTEWVQAPASTINDNVGHGSGAVIGEMDGVVYEVTVDNNGYLVWTQQEDSGEDEEDGLVWVEQDVLDAISDAINEKTGGTGDYRPSQMPSAIRGINVCTMSQADDGKVVQGGRLVSQSTIRITQNGTYDTTTKSEALVTVAGSMEFDSSDLGKVVVAGDNGYELAGQTTLNVSENGTYDTTSKNVTVVSVQSEPAALGTKTITENGTYNASNDSLDGYSSVNVNVSGDSSSLSSADLGKVVSSVPDAYIAGDEREYTLYFVDGSEGCTNSSSNGTFTITRGSGANACTQISVNPTVMYEDDYGCVLTFDFVTSAIASGNLGYMAASVQFVHGADHSELYQCDNITNETTLQTITVQLPYIGSSRYYLGINVSGLPQGATATISNIKCYRRVAGGYAYELVEQTARRIDRDGTYDTTEKDSVTVMVGRESDIRLRCMHTYGCYGSCDGGGVEYNMNLNYTKGPSNEYAYLYIVLGITTQGIYDSLTIGNTYCLHFIAQAVDTTFSSNVAFGYEVSEYPPSPSLINGRQIVIQHSLSKDTVAHEYFVTFTATDDEMYFSIDTTAMSSGGKLIVSDIYVFDPNALPS